MIIINQTKLAAMSNVWKLKYSIPNQEGFKLICLLASGLQALATVLKNKTTGCYSLDISKDIEYKGILGWRDFTGADKEAVENME